MENDGKFVVNYRSYCPPLPKKECGDKIRQGRELINMDIWKNLELEGNTTDELLVTTIQCILAVTMLGVEEDKAKEMGRRKLAEAREQPEALTERKRVAAGIATIRYGFYELLEHKYAPRKYSDRIKKTLQYIHENLNRNPRVTEAASLVNTNPNYLSRLFRQEMGKSFSRYVSELKARTAMRMLDNRHNFSSQEIAEALGFSSRSNFIRAFQKTAGQTPEQYRKRGKN